MLVKGTISVSPVSSIAVNPNDNNKEVVFKSYALFIDCISERNNTQINNAKDIDAVIPLYNFIEYPNNYSRNLGSFMAIPQSLTIFRC